MVLVEQCGQGIQKDVQLGYIRKLEIKEAEELRKSHNRWYLPHFFVVHPEKPGEIRGVFDAPCETGGVSLNSIC